MTGLSTKTDFYQLVEKALCSSRETQYFFTGLNVGKKIKNYWTSACRQIPPKIHAPRNMIGII